MNDSKVTMLGFFLFLLCAALIGGVWYLNSEVDRLHNEYEGLQQQKVDLSQDTNNLKEQKKVFLNKFKELDEFSVSTASNDMDFYSQVQEAVKSSEITILSTNQRPAGPDGRSSIVMTLRGDYYSMMSVLSKWRSLPITVRVSTMQLSAPKGTTVATGGEVEANLTVEAIVGSNTSAKN